MKHSAICIPATPRGVTLFSIAVAAHKLSGNGLKTWTLRQLFGRVDANIVSCFGASALLAESMGVIEDGKDLLRHAGLFGFYASAMSEARAEDWLSELRRKTFDGPHPQHFVTGMSQQRLVKRAMYCCRQCMQEDETKYGLAFWRTVHQIPGIYDCPTHHAPLFGACLGCGRSQGSDHEWNLPSLSCPHCGTREFSTAARNGSRGYARHLSLVQQVCSGSGELLRPAVRDKLFAEAFGGKAGPNVTLIIRKMLEMWECESLAELSASSGTKITSQFVGNAVRGAYAGVNPIAQLVLVALADWTLQEEQLRASVGPLYRANESPQTDFESALSGLEAALEMAGLPPKMAVQLVAGLSLTKISALEGIPYPRLRRQIGRVLERNIDELWVAASDGSLAQAIRRNLQALADKLRRPLRRSNTFPSQRAVIDLEELRALNRSKVNRYLQQGVQTRKQLHYKNSDLGDWCRMYDSGWFETVLPTIPQAERKGVGRRKGGRNSSNGAGSECS